MNDHEHDVERAQTGRMIEELRTAGPVTTLELAARTGLDHGRAYGTLVQLERRGLVRRRGAPGAWSWRLTRGSASRDR